MDLVINIETFIMAITMAVASFLLVMALLWIILSVKKTNLEK